MKTVCEVSPWRVQAPVSEVSPLAVSEVSPLRVQAPGGAGVAGVAGGGGE